jgi:hypothetical protein
MSLAYSFRHNHTVTNETFQPFKTVSVRDMLNFYAQRWLELANVIGQQRGLIEAQKTMVGFMEAVGGKDRDPRANPIPGFSVELFPHIHSELIRMGLTVSAAAAEKIAQFKKRPWDRKDVEYIDQLCDELVRILQYELESRRVLILDPPLAQFYERAGTLFGEEALNKFPALREDAEEAAKCYALGRSTASVFHLMRVMERCLQKMASDLGVPDKITCEKEWQVIINQVRGKVKDKWPNEKDPTRIKHTALIGHLETVKIAWRNPTMHPKATYTEREAEKIIGAVQAFVEDFSTL